MFWFWFTKSLTRWFQKHCFITLTLEFRFQSIKLIIFSTNQKEGLSETTFFIFLSLFIIKGTCAIKNHNKLFSEHTELHVRRFLTKICHNLAFSESLCIFYTQRIQKYRKPEWNCWTTVILTTEVSRLLSVSKMQE